MLKLFGLCGVLEEKNTGLVTIRHAGSSTSVLISQCPYELTELVVEDEKPYLFWMQMRMGITAPTPVQLALLGRLFMLQAARAGYSDVGLLIADMRNVDGDERVLRLIPIAELVIASEAEAESKLQLFADAHDQLMREGFDPKAERMARRRRPDGEGPQPSFL